MSSNKSAIEVPANSNPLYLTIIGWVLSALPALGLLMGGGMMISKSEMVMKDLVEKFHFPETAAVPLGIVVVTSVILYLLPWTSTLGAILLTGYLGGAVCTHLSQNEGFVPALIAGALVWLGLVLRDPRVRAVLPVRF